MTLPTYPNTLPTPEQPFSGDLANPLAESSVGEIGAYLTYRDKTRACLRGGANLNLDLSQLQVFLTWWNTTTNKGLIPFKAQWITDIGYKGYVGKITSYSNAMNGIRPIISLALELEPYIQLNATTGKPDPYPNKVNA